MDTLTKRQRSVLMAKIRSRGNKATELELMRFLRRAGISGWRRNLPLPGKPDFTFRASRLVVFVDGCYWHGCSRHCRIPTSNRRYWLQKIARNKARDQVVNRTLRRAGWRVLRVWEHELAKKNQARLVRLIQRALSFFDTSPRPSPRSRRRG